MSQAMAVANELVRLSYAGEEPDPLTNLRLQKLLYFAQGWSIHLRNSALFDDPLQAWEHGPVAPSVYHACKGAGKQVFAPEVFAGAEPLTADESAFLRAFWDEYRKYGVWQLVDLSHAEAPWKNARGGLPPDARCEAEISADDMDACFSGKPMPAPLHAYQSARRREEDEAVRWLADRPPIDRGKLAGVAVRRQPG